MGLVSAPPSDLARARLGLLANQASVGPGYRHAVTLIDRALPGRLQALFGPQHGFAGEKQDNMVESGHARESGGRRPIWSLYGDRRRPDPAWMEDLDVLLIDLVDVGTRVYTFAQTAAYCLETAAAAGVRVVVLDRPNPIGGLAVEGNLLQPDCASFVGLYPIPMRHGFTMGELCRFMARFMEPKPELDVIPATGWRRDMYFAETGLPWVLPSPNMPTPETAWVYPGQVLLEGANISEGRGTTRPFQLCGAPFIDGPGLAEALTGRDLPGAIFRAADFEPTFHKFRGEVCHGVEIHPVDPRSFKPYLTTLTLLEILLARYPGTFAWRPPPYEYETERLPMDLLIGDRDVRMALENGVEAAALAERWRPAFDRFLEERREVLLYPELEEGP